MPSRKIIAEQLRYFAQKVERRASTATRLELAKVRAPDGSATTRFLEKQLAHDGEQVNAAADELAEMICNLFTGTPTQ